MKIEWERNPDQESILWGKTASKFKAQVAPSTEGGYVWVIFHNDSGFAQWGDLEDSVDQAKKTASKWLKENSESWLVTNPKNEI